jgi:AcrR family transcriptional regulator
MARQPDAEMDRAKARRSGGRAAVTVLALGRARHREHRVEPPAASRADRRGTQRERLLDALRKLSSRHGLDTATVGQIVALAGVSRPSFYEYFTDKEDCLLAALQPLHRDLLTEIGAALAQVRPEHAAQASVCALHAFARCRPDDARLLISDPLAGGQRALDARDELIARAARLVEQRFAGVRSRVAIPALPPRLIVGVSCRLLASHLRRAEPCDPALLHELLDWLARYELPAGDRRWRALASLAHAESSPSQAGAALRAPAVLAPARSRMRRDAAIENQWLRIVFATAEVIAERGYAASTVAQITLRAGLDARAFYRLFSSKEQALADARELMFRHLMAVTAGAFAGGESWPERVCEAGAAFAGCVERNPALSHVCFVEGHAGGRVAMGRLQELVSAFTIFLQEGYRYEPPGRSRREPPPSSLVLEAVVTSVFELCYLQGRDHRGQALSSTSEHVAFICLASFLGAHEANACLSRGPLASEAQRLLRPGPQQAPASGHPTLVPVA